MSLKSIRESYSKLLTTFNDAGIKLNESQKTDLDGFVLAIESTMSKQRESAIRKTKAAVTAKLEGEFKQIFESIMDTVSENNKLASKIEKLSNKMTESKKVANTVDKFLDLYVESVLPKKTIVDYDRMQKLEKIQESLKSLLVIDDAAIAEKQKALDESFKAEKSKCETEVAKMQVKLDESSKKIKDLTKKLESLKAVEILESKTRDLPDFEARVMKKRLCEATAPEIEKKFAEVLESVRAEAKRIAEDEETTLESEITKIVGADEAEEVKENDLLKNKPHNAHISEGEEEKKDGEEAVDEDEDFETMEEVKEDADGNIELDESEIIDADLMKLWCNQAIEVR